MHPVILCRGFNTAGCKKNTDAMNIEEQSASTFRKTKTTKCSRAVVNQYKAAESRNL